MALEFIYKGGEVNMFNMQRGRSKYVKIICMNSLIKEENTICLKERYMYGGIV